MPGPCLLPGRPTTRPRQPPAPVRSSQFNPELWPWSSLDSMAYIKPIFWQATWTTADTKLGAPGYKNNGWPRPRSRSRDSHSQIRLDQSAGRHTSQYPGSFVRPSSWANGRDRHMADSSWATGSKAPRRNLCNLPVLVFIQFTSHHGGQEIAIVDPKQRITLGFDVSGVFNAVSLTLSVNKCFLGWTKCFTQTKLTSTSYYQIWHHLWQRSKCRLFIPWLSNAWNDSLMRQLQQLGHGLMGQHVDRNGTTAANTLT